MITPSFPLFLLCHPLTLNGVAVGGVVDPNVAVTTGVNVPLGVDVGVGAGAGVGIVDVNQQQQPQLDPNSVGTVEEIQGGVGNSHEAHLANRRQKDRQRYALMSNEQREVYNSKRREQYHRQSEISRKKRRERERIRYHSLEHSKAKDRNSRRASLERERYKKLTPEELAQRNAKRRSRAAALRAQKKAMLAAQAAGSGNQASANANTASGAGAGAVSSDGNILVSNAAPENGHESMGGVNGAVHLAPNDHEHVQEQMHVMPEVVPGADIQQIQDQAHIQHHDGIGMNVVGMGVGVDNTANVPLDLPIMDEHGNQAEV